MSGQDTDKGGEGYAVFPLHTVLFPGCQIPLRIFEQRYLRLISESTQNDKPFVISLIKGQGKEVGSKNACYDIACLARVVDFNQDQPGVLDIVARAGSRVRIQNACHEKDNLMRADLESFSESELIEIPDYYSSLLGVLESIKQKNSDVISEKIDSLSATEVSFYLSYFAPISTIKKQRLLEMQNTEARLEALQSIFSETRISFMA